MSDKMIQIPLPFEEPMDNFTAVMIAEGVYQAKNQQQYIEAWQQLIDTGMVWTLQGWFRRTAQDLIDEGHCTAPNS